MKEQANKELVQKLYAAFGKGDVQTILDHLASDVEWTLEGPELIPFAGARRGPAGVRGFFEALGSTQNDQKLTVEVMIAEGDQVAVFGRYSGQVKATGKRFDTPLAHLFTIRDSKVIRYVNLIDTAAIVGAYTNQTATAR